MTFVEAQFYDKSNKRTQKRTKKQRKKRSQTTQHFFENFSCDRNIFQMDGMKYVVPFSCKNQKNVTVTLFGKEEEEIECMGCKKGYADQHNGIYCKVKDWNTGKTMKFIDLINEGEQ